MVNEREIEFYKKHSLTYETENKPFSLKIDENSIYYFNDLVNFLYILKAHPGKNTILEAACGGGWLTKILAKFNYEITAFEQSKEIIEKNIKVAKERGLDIDYEIGDFENFSTEKKFDIGIIYDALHHTKNPEKVIEMFNNNLNPSALLIISEPSLLHKISKGAKATTKEHGIIEEGFSRWQLRKLLIRNGFHRIKFFYRNEMVHYRGYNWFFQILRNLFKRCFYYPGEKIWVTALKRSVRKR